MRLMDKLTMQCRLCGSEVQQDNYGYEIGMNYWYSYLTPWDTLFILCRKCGKKLLHQLGGEIRHKWSKEEAAKLKH